MEDLKPLGIVMFLIVIACTFTATCIAVFDLFPVFQAFLEFKGVPLALRINKPVVWLVYKGVGFIFNAIVAIVVLKHLIHILKLLQGNENDK